MAFKLRNTLGTQNERYFVAASPTAHSLACLRIGDLVTADAARLATGVGGLALHRTGFAPVGRRTKFHDVTASSLPFDQPCLVALRNNAALTCRGRSPSFGSLNEGRGVNPGVVLLRNRVRHHAGVEVAHRTHTEIH